ncbi:hypothetical protein SF123566_8906 [Shigella flexneri 1235-66]|nr:hypothetical protein SF123566_8906 [Shigella flexneri 1235-66]
MDRKPPRRYENVITIETFRKDYHEMKRKLRGVKQNAPFHDERGR